MATENDILRDAIIGTEKEIFAESFDKEDLTHDETGDRSQEAMGDGLEGQVEPEDEDGEGEGEGEGEAEVQTEGAVETAPEGQTTPPQTEPQPDTQGRVPAGRLREEAERARAAIAERDQIMANFQAAQRAIAEREAVIQQLAQAAQSLTNRQQPQAPTPEAQKEPDLYEDPIAYAERIDRKVNAAIEAHNREIRDREVNASLEYAHQRHGKVYEEAFATLKSLDFRNPDNVTLVRRMEASPNPGETVVAWHRRNQALREVGTDIDGYRNRIAEETRKTLMADPEFRKELLASLRGEAMTGDDGRPRTQTKLPRSLTQTAGNGARANDVENFDGSPRAAFDSAWAT